MESFSHSMESTCAVSVHTNTIEGFFSIFKRGMKGVYQHCGHNHLHRYLAEFDFRYNNRSRSALTTRRAPTPAERYRWEAPHLSNGWYLMPKKKHQLSRRNSRSGS